MRYIDTICKGRRYRDAIKKNTSSVNKITDSINKNKDESQYNLSEYDKKLKDIAVEFNISQSRISRIIQNALDKVKKELLKQERLEEDYSEE